MASIIFVSWLVFIVSLLILNFGNIVLIIIARNRIKRKQWEGEDTAELILGIVCVAAGIALYYVTPNNATRIKMFYDMKPKCQEETVSCLSKKAEWYKDSIEYKVVLPKENNKALIDSLKNVVKQYEK